MLKQILIAIGLRKAPTPVRNYVAASSLVGGVPALAYVAWRHRDQIAALWRSATTRRQAATA
ncbi:MAG: hypothetical protein Q8S73_09765 [Deltaproteobacteria bacterium]|jgi:Flp pilus assembly protein protease CpaA|nr:hypothetical protein [Myxococcales bacterium]MDP3214379.1 hypothetical protein [Deltaproteobacteria bacterium]